MTKLYESSRGKPAGHIIHDPRWKCPSCRSSVNEPFARKCRKCKRLEVEAPPPVKSVQVSDEGWHDPT